MIRHIFIATIKPGVTAAQVEATMQQMRAMPATVPEIKAITVGRSLGLAGPTNTVSMVIDTADRASFERLFNSATHQQISATAGDVFQTDNFVLSQIEIND